MPDYEDSERNGLGDDTWWRNKKNGMLYKVHGVGCHTETREALVMYTDAQGSWYARPTGLFMEKFERAGGE